MRPGTRGSAGEACGTPLPRAYAKSRHLQQNLVGEPGSVNNANKQRRDAGSGKRFLPTCLMYAKLCKTTCLEVKCKGHLFKWLTLGGRTRFPIRFPYVRVETPCSQVDVSEVDLSNRW